MAGAQLHRMADGIATGWRDLNPADREEWAPLHLGAYDVGPLRAGRGRPTAIEEAELGPVAGLRMLHLKCHIGDDTLTLSPRGAIVTGADFSSAAIDAGRGLATELGVPARFVLADLYGAPEVLTEPGILDLVYTTWGTVSWLPDIRRWADVVAYCLRPGGSLYFADAHPTLEVFDDRAERGPDGRPGWFAPYLGQAPIPVDSADDYADTAAILINRRQVSWIHPLGATLSKVDEAGLRLEWLREHPRIASRLFQCLERDADGMWAWPDRAWLPLSVSLRAVRQ